MEWMLNTINSALLRNKQCTIHSIVFWYFFQIKDIKLENLKNSCSGWV